jgi:hypothetical protein
LTTTPTTPTRSPLTTGPAPTTTQPFTEKFATHTIETKSTNKQKRPTYLLFLSHHLPQIHNIKKRAHPEADFTAEHNSQLCNTKRFSFKNQEDHHATTHAPLSLCTKHTKKNPSLQNTKHQ